MTGVAAEAGGAGGPNIDTGHAGSYIAQPAFTLPALHAVARPAARTKAGLAIRAGPAAALTGAAVVVGHDEIAELGAAAALIGGGARAGQACGIAGGE